MNKSCTSLLATVLIVISSIGKASAVDAQFTFATLAGKAGSVISSAEGTGSAAQFSAPRGAAVDSAGNVYIADSNNNTIRKITAAGVVTTLAGTAGSSGYKDGTGTATLFNEPFALAVDSAGNVFVADTNSNAIRKITPAGVVTTLAGGSGKGTTDGTGTAAKFHEPRGIAIDSTGTLYVADYENHMVRKVTSAGVVTTLAGGPDISGYVDGQGTAARFMAPQGIAVDSAGNVYVTENGSRGVRKITPAGLVTTLVRGSGVFGEPRGLTIDASGNLYVADYSANVIRKVTAAGVVSTYAGIPPTPGSTDGTTTTALFNAPNGVTVDSSNNVYVADTSNNTVRKISSTGMVTTLAGLAGRTSSVDGTATTARFDDPYAVAVDGSGNLYVADATDHSIRKITSDGTVTTLAGKGGSFGSADGTGTAARFKGPLGIAADSAGNVYVADTGNLTVRKITPAGVVTTLAGSAGQAGSTDGTGTAARFMSPYGITVDSTGTLYVVESSAVVRKVTAAGVVTTLAGTSGTNGLTNATGTAARFSVPFDIAADGAGNLYVSDHGNHVVRKITPSGVVTTLAGSGSMGKTDGTGTAASFKFPSGIAADSAGNVFLADTDNQVIRKITPAGVTTTIGGTGFLGSADGIGTAASFYNPKDVAVDTSGKIYVVDRGNHTIRLGVEGGTTTTPPVVTLPAATGITTTLSLSGSAFVLDVPYLEFTSGSKTEAYAVQFSSAALTSFSLVPGSVKAVAVSSSATRFPKFSATSSDYKLTMPYLEFVSGATRAGYAVNLLSSDLASFTIEPGSVTSTTSGSSVGAPSAVTAIPTALKTVGTYSFGASSKLTVAWKAPAATGIDHYEITATEPLTNTSTKLSVKSSSTTETLTALRAATKYTITVSACSDSACTNPAKSSEVSATTPEEYWQLQGTATGNTVASLTKPVADGNARLSATRFGAEAGAVANTVQFYYGPQGVSGQSVATSGIVSASNPASYLSGFTSYAATSGVRSPSSVVTGIKDIMTGQGVPLSAAMGGKVRLFFESNDADKKTRIYSVDSVDGYVGRDFNSGATTTCTASADYLPGGSCPASVVIGVSGDTVNPTNKISAARQNKIAWPTLTDWRWNGDIGTFMVFTIDKVAGCTTASHNHGYAQWDGSKFVPQYDSNGCPKSFNSAQAALPMHIGGVRYKMYFGDPSVTTGKPTGSGLPFVGPKKLIYSDGTISGPTTSVEFEDWETVSAARNVNFLWPNGELLNDKAEGYIDDFHFLTPTGNLDIQVLYMSITDGSVAPFAATAVLLNP